LNDAVIADRLLREIEGVHAELMGSASFTRGYLCAANEQDMRELVKRWKQFRAMAPP